MVFDFWIYGIVYINGVLKPLIDCICAFQTSVYYVQANSIEFYCDRNLYCLNQYALIMVSGGAFRPS